MPGQIAAVAEAFAIAPLKGVAISRDLNGSRGTIREWNVPRQIGADTDVAAVVAWLANFTERPAMMPVRGSPISVKPAAGRPDP